MTHVSNPSVNPLLVVPVVGMGATICHWTDRSGLRGSTRSAWIHMGAACTIIAVLSTKKVVVQEDHAKRTDSNGMSESQTYAYERNPEGSTYTFTLRANGRWCQEGQTSLAIIGGRHKYHDFSF